MASITSNVRPGFSAAGLAIRPLTAIWAFIESVAEANARAHAVRELSALSDAALAKRGLKRRDIVSHVFNSKAGA